MSLQWLWLKVQIPEESKLVDIIRPAIDSVYKAILQRDTSLFRSSYILVTVTCNNSHHTAAFEFNMVNISVTKSFSKYDFKTAEK